MSEHHIYYHGVQRTRTVSGWVLIFQLCSLLLFVGGTPYFAYNLVTNGTLTDAETIAEHGPRGSWDLFLGSLMWVTGAGTAAQIVTKTYELPTE